VKRTWTSALLLSLAACSGGDEGVDAGPLVDAGGAVDAGEVVDAGPEPCESWLIEYDIDGSEFEIRNTPFGAGDAINQVGPGRLQLRFPGDEAGPQAGDVVMLQFSLDMTFAVSMVETDVTITSGPADCGVAMGSRTSSVVTWSSPIAGYRSQGTITCNAGELLCGAAGLPVGEPVTQDETHDQPLMPFVFADEDNFTHFTMAEVEVPNDDAGDTFLRLEGTQVTRRCAALPTDCN